MSMCRYPARSHRLLGVRRLDPEDSESDSYRMSLSVSSRFPKGLT
ncbi:hypothetical protein I547_0371 [Mycobacterium kansasii 824]|uniref:Uncharacterized protein n=1 Tax=Mycobacterium kansasii TaxID=1768 RepID=A0A1V3Y0R5_MYCKA|nr:hypothetical protein I547_0371 [Mycobacterium kansasii 824]KEP43044.1 hypothetical protein MKSMC1_18360 [Mycobacterium kansasii]OOK81620.1 hypothetical protein BZL30_0773 [Mycobacterium kansasii]OOK84586.1 hypothetical protein BZL29_1090 [Mycobacterium kansasii]